MSTPLKHHLLRSAIIERIQTAGPIPFTEFMETALYHPELGYYTSGRPVWGPDGDYITSLDVSPVFALAIAKQAREMWELLGSPAEFTFVDAGAGRGLLTKGVLEATKKRWPDFFPALRPVMVDVSAEAEGNFEKEVTRCLSLDDVKPFEAGLIVSNELLDALPFHRVVMEEDGLKEIYTALKDDEFVDATGGLSTPALSAYFKKLGLELRRGQRAEVGLKAIEWIKAAAGLIGRGFVMTIDYGLPARELYAPEKDGTLLCHHRHTINDNPYERVGEQDITAHVDFTSVCNAGTEAGLEAAGFTTQLHFLLGVGVLDELIEVGDETDGAVDAASAIRHNQGIKRLIMPGQMGETFKVLIQRKGMKKSVLGGLSFKNGIEYLQAARA